MDNNYADLEQQHQTQNDEDNGLMVNYMYIEKVIEIERPISYSLRGFGFLINSCKSSIDGNICAQIAVVEPNTVASASGLQVNDHVLEINKQSTKDLTNEQLRKIIRECLAQNSVELRIMRAVPISGEYSKNT